jgi:hypothetical protein
MNKMTIKEQCKRIIYSQQAVLYLIGRPGTAKTQILRSIAEEEGFQFFDFRLSQRDSSEVIGVPFKEKMLDENGNWVMKYAIPEIYYLANQKKTLIIFEELNRATLETRNAALQILLEREIGTFKFNDNVYFAATGNLGSDSTDKEENDDCDVESFDRALWGRLATLKHDMTYDEWYDNFAKENINPFILDYIRNNLDHWYVAKDNEKAYTCVRSYTFLSNFIGKTEKNINKMLDDVINFGSRYLHSSTVASLTRYLQNLSKITINDIIDRFDEVKNILDSLNKSFLNEFCEKLKTIKLNSLTKKQFNNLIKFLEYMPDDEKCSYLYFLLEDNLAEDDCEKLSKKVLSEDDKKNILKKQNKNFLDIIKHFSDLIEKLEEKACKIEEEKVEPDPEVEKK